MRKSLLAQAVFGLAFAALMLTGTYGSAATITWGAATNVNTGANNTTGTLTDFSTAGTFFDSAIIRDSSDLTILTSPNILMHRRDVSDVTDPYSFIGSAITLHVASGAIGFSEQVTGGFVGSNVYMQMLQRATFGGGSRDLTISGLTSGHQYQVQVWTPYWNTSGGIQTSFTAVNSVSLNVGYTTSSTNPANIVTLPQFALGTFTANAATQVISYQGVGGNALFAAIQVRDLTPAPEPGSFGIMIIGLVGVTRVLRRRRLHV